MKKLLIITVVTCFSFISCEKVDIIPIQQPVETLSKISNVKNCYLLSNIETAPGRTEYRVIYVDCNNVIQNVALSYGQRLMICLNEVRVETNFAYTLAFRGDCITARP